jgi:hypothetical protein
VLDVDGEDEIWRRKMKGGVVVKMRNSEMFIIFFNLNPGNIDLPRVSHP